MDWWYRNSFNIPRNKKGEKVKLILNGINYKAEIWFNRQLLGTMTGAFERGIFDITPWVDYDKKNLLVPFVFFRLTIPVFLTRQIGKKELVPMVEHCAWMVLLLSLQKAGIGFPAYATETWVFGRMSESNLEMNWKLLIHM